jgi:hypothetical protein
MRRGFFRLWVVASVLWALPWIGLGVSDGMFVTPAHEVALDDASFNAALGLPPHAKHIDVMLATFNAANHGTLPKGQQVPAAFNPDGTLAVLAFVASVPALLLAIGWAFSGFSGAVRRG